MHMTVEKLIKKLQKFPPKTKVAVSGGFNGEEHSRNIEIVYGKWVDIGDGMHSVLEPEWFDDEVEPDAVALVFKE